jgi:hypoxanthine phosphoribosyltransferase
MPELISVLDKDALAQKVAGVAQQISNDYRSGDVIAVGVLKGAFVFMADMVRQLTLNSLKIDFVRVASYGIDTQTSGDVKILCDLQTDIQGKDVLIVEDIVDSGLTLKYLYHHLNKQRPGSIKICALIDKTGRRQTDLKPDYVCCQIDHGFLVGYGLDYAESYRNLPGIYRLKL